jgi:transposase-like protein
VSRVDCVIPLRRSLESWSQVIQADLIRSVEGLLAAGQHLSEARSQHPRGTFLAWLETGECGLSKTSAYRLMDICSRAQDFDVLRSGNIMTHLPPVPSTLAELFHLEPPALEEAVHNGTVHPAMTRDQARELTEGVTRGRKSKYPPEVRDAALALLSDGVPRKDVAAMMGLPVPTVQGWKRKYLEQDHGEPATEAQLTRLITETANTLDALVSSIALVDTRGITPDPTTWTWLDSITESLKRLTRFAKELTHARDH